MEKHVHLHFLVSIFLNNLDENLTYLTVYHLIHHFTHFTHENQFPRHEEYYTASEDTKVFSGSSSSEKPTLVMSL